MKETAEIIMIKTVNRNNPFYVYDFSTQDWAEYILKRISVFKPKRIISVTPTVPFEAGFEAMEITFTTEIVK